MASIGHSEDTSTLRMAHNLGLRYKNQGKMVEAETMYLRALQGKEKAWGVEHTSTLDMVHSLDILYAKQGKMAEAGGDVPAGATESKSREDRSACRRWTRLTISVTCTPKTC